MNNKLLLFVFVAIKWNTILTIIIRNHMVHCPDVFKLWHLIEYLAHTVVQSVIIVNIGVILNCTHWYKFESLKFGKQFFNERFVWALFWLSTNRRKVTHSLTNALWIVGYKCGFNRNQVSSWKISNRRRDLCNEFYLQWWSDVVGDELHSRKWSFYFCKKKYGL